MSSVAAAPDYLRLIADTPPKVIRTEAENRFYLAKLEELASRWDGLSDSERDLYATLALLVEDFERRTYKIPEARPAEVIQELLEIHGLRQKDLVGIFPTASIVSEVLSGRRALRVEHIRRLSERFHVSPAVFF